MNEPSDPNTQETQPPPRKGGVFLGRFFGIRFYLDYSWFLIAALVVWGLSATWFPAVLPGRPSAVYLGLGTLAAVLFFLSILLHELGHSVVSQRCGIPVPRITLLFIGGIAEISREPDSARAELKIALGGPIVTLLLIIAYVLLQILCSAAGIEEIAMVFHWLWQVNLILLVFNAIPGYPLDGGRVLRALLWAKSRNLRKATYITSRIGVGFSWLLIALGILGLFQGLLNAFVFLLIGIFLKTAAESGYMQALYTEVLHGIRVRDIMSSNPICIPAHLPVNLAVDDYFLAKHHVTFPVCDDDGRFLGLLKLAYLKLIDREKWPFTSAGDVVSANDSAELSIDAETPANLAMRRLLQPGQGRLAVLDNGKTIGIITRADILKFIRIHTELEA